MKISAMGRNVPMEEIASSHPALSLTLFVAWMTILVAVISSLCGIWSKKSPKSDDPDDPNKTTSPNDEAAETPSSPNSKSTPQTPLDDANTNDFDIKPLKPPPSAAKLELGNSSEDGKPSKIDKSSSLQNYMSKTTSRRKLSVSISMRMPSMIKDKAAEITQMPGMIKDKAAEISHHHKKPKQEESLWTKRIMLGEKCKLPSGDDDDETTLYNVQRANNNKVLTYSQSQKPMSSAGSGSVIEQQDDVSSSSSREEKLKDKDKDKDKEKGKQICSDDES